jgi:dTDP-4-dehydrorhamnose 3,5-epimerase-like enzyme
MNFEQLEPAIIPGGISVDDRGIVAFHNSVDLASWTRFYLVSNHRVGFIRAWHGHRNERKLVIPIIGTFLISCVQIDDWGNPSKNLKTSQFILSSTNPRSLYIPNGYANGFKSLTQASTLMFLSSSSLQESLSDDIRFPWNYWNPWDEDFR